MRNKIWFLKKQTKRIVDMGIYDTRESFDRFKKQQDDPMLAVWIRCGACGKEYENFSNFCSKCGRRYD